MCAVEEKGVKWESSGGSLFKKLFPLVMYFGHVHFMLQRSLLDIPAIILACNQL